MTVMNPGPGLREQFVALPDGRRIRTVIAGESVGPLVVFEAGMSAPAATWIHTQREISASAPTLSYDRAGYGGSDVDPHDRTLQRIVDDLTAVLDALGQTDPVVLVGHSWGGPVLRLFAYRHPERVAGLVLVDATVVEGVPERSAKLAAPIFSVLALLARLGAKGMVRRAMVPHGLSPEISDSDAEIIWRDYLSARAMRTGAREAQQILAALPALRHLQDVGTPDVPTVCVQGGRADRGMASLRRALNAAAARLMMAAPSGRVVVVEQAGHLVPQECPAEVREAILAVLEAVRVRR